MIYKSEKTAYDKTAMKYIPVWEFNTEDTIKVVTHVDEETLETKTFDFYSECVRYHVNYTESKYPERFQKLVNEGKILEYLEDLETKTEEAIDRQVDLWLENDKAYRIAIDIGDIRKSAAIHNAFISQAKEIIYPCMVYI